MPSGIIKGIKNNFLSFYLPVSLKLVKKAGFNGFIFLFHSPEQPVKHFQFPVWRWHWLLA